MSKEEARRYRELAAENIRAAEVLEKKLQKECVHPFESLDFYHGGVESRMGLEESILMRIECRKCDKRLSKQLRWFNDP